MKKLLLLSLIAISLQMSAQNSFPVRGFCIEAPRVNDVDLFVKFINEELAPRNVNTLILRVEYGFQYKSHPELSQPGGLSQKDVDKLVEACRKHNIRLIPQINLLGHQSWASTIGNLLKVYPQFDETPHVKMPEKHEWPNPDGLYCKSYCPLHPEVHDVVFALTDEICDAFKADAFHAGMDEVFYIGDDKCPRCGGRDKAELFAGELTKIRNHLALKGRQLWIWGDRLIDGKTTGMGMWEASMNNTHRAIDLLPKDIMVCDWHYERPDKTPVYFAMKGFSVITCPWKKAENARIQTRDMYLFRETATREMKNRYQGMMQTVWSGANRFLKEFYSDQPAPAESETACFKALFDEINKK